MKNMFKLKQTFSKNAKGVDYFVGDIHGAYDLFLESLDDLNFDKSVDRCFSVGDLIDRGPKSEESLNLLKEDWFHAVVGNHEKMMCDNNDAYIWMRNGGKWGYMKSIDEISKLRELVFDNMSQLIEVETDYGTFGLVHAESEDSWLDNTENSLDKNIWSRLRINNGFDIDVQDIDIVVCGHTPLENSRALGNVLYIDTGAVFNNNLTILTAEEVFNKVHF